jgi:hypothetical protein
MRNPNCAADGGDFREMRRYELDRLFGLALTDSCFYRQLRADPYRAIAEFDLTQEEKQAVLCIVPLALSIGDLAMRLDAWMTGIEQEAATVAPAERSQAQAPVRKRMPLTPRAEHERHALGQRLPRRRAPVPIGDDEQRVCLILNERIYRS